jgi:DnaJ-class molecular chaperone
MTTSVMYCPHNEEQNVECKITTCPCCGGLGVAAQCPSCNGTGAIYARTLREAQLAHTSQWEKCETCKGRGYFPITVELFERLGHGTPEEIAMLYKRRPARRAS